MKKRVLIVDNNTVILRLFSHYFEQKGYEVETAEDGLDALKVMESFHPDLMFVDLIMPKINGEKLCRIIRKIPELDSTYIVIVSAIAAEETIDFVSFGANACIAKGPFGQMQDHISTVLRCFENSQIEPLSKNILGVENIYERDITKELLATKKHFEMALNNIADGFLELTLDSRVIFANKAATELFGVSEEELLSSSFPKLFLGEQREMINNFCSRLDDRSIEIGDDTPVVLRGKYLFIRLVPFIDQGQKYTIALIQDITHRKESELALINHKEVLEDIVAQRTVEFEEANEQLQEEIIERSKVQEQLIHSVKQWRETFDIMSDFVSVLGADMRFQKVNKSLANFLGKKPAELIGKHCYELIHNSHEPPPNCPHVKAIKKQEVVTGEIKDPHLRKTLLVTCSPVFDNDGTAIGTVHVARDITSQKLAQKEREELIAELQKALKEIKTLSGFIPICSSCKNIRDDKGFWSKIESYISARTEAEFSHSVCPDCALKLYPDLTDEEGNFIDEDESTKKA